MKSDTKAFIAEEGGKLLYGLIRLAIIRPRKSSLLGSETQSPTNTTYRESPAETTIKEPGHEELPLSPTGEVVEMPIETPQEELDYRWECCMKHLGGASGLLLEAYERAIDEGIGEGTAEKIMEALNAHSTMEADLEKMLAMPEAKTQAEKLLSGVRAFRRASWEAKLPTGGGTKDDISDARLWNNILYTEAFASAKSQPGAECIREGM